MKDDKGKFCPEGHIYRSDASHCPICGTRGKQDTVILERSYCQSQPLIFGWLAILAGEDRGKAFRISATPVRIGTNEKNEIILSDSGVSETHAQIEWDPHADSFVLTDRKSSKGVFLNDSVVAIDEAHLIDGDTIRIGETVFRFKCVEERDL